MTPVDVIRPPSEPPVGLLKEQVAAQLRDAIMGGVLAPGQRVIESVWAQKVGTAQASVREAINILIGEGLLTKDSGRSAKVTRYTEEDVTALYQVRAALEGLAAYLVTEAKIGIERMEQALDGMSAAIAKRDMRTLIQCDLEFHLSLTELSGNAFLIDSAKRLLGPLFAFVAIRVLKSGQGPEAWETDMPRHRRIVELIKEGDPVIAEQYVKRSYRHFVSSAYAVWENVGGAVEAHRKGREAKRRKRRPGFQGEP
jgi:DNA-binding GntR family transcriptional regulator